MATQSRAGVSAPPANPPVAANNHVPAPTGRGFGRGVVRGLGRGGVTGGHHGRTAQNRDFVAATTPTGIGMFDPNSGRSYEVDEKSPLYQQLMDPRSGPSRYLVWTPPGGAAPSNLSVSTLEPVKTGKSEQQQMGPLRKRAASGELANPPKVAKGSAFADVKTATEPMGAEGNKKYWCLQCHAIGHLVDSGFCPEVDGGEDNQSRGNPVFTSTKIQTYMTAKNSEFVRTQNESMLKINPPTVVDVLNILEHICSFLHEYEYVMERRDHLLSNILTVTEQKMGPDSRARLQDLVTMCCKADDHLVQQIVRWVHDTREQCVFVPLKARMLEAQIETVPAHEAKQRVAWVLESEEHDVGLGYSSWSSKRDEMFRILEVAMDHRLRIFAELMTGLQLEKELDESEPLAKAWAYLERCLIQIPDQDTWSELNVTQLLRWPEMIKSWQTLLKAFKDKYPDDLLEDENAVSSNSEPEGDVGSDNEPDASILEELLS